MLPRTKINVLLQIRADIIRDGLEGLEHANALLVLRGIDPASQNVRRKASPLRFRQAELKRLIQQALNSGPMPLRVLAVHIDASKPDLPAGWAYKRLSIALARLHREGRVRRGEGMWWLAKLNDGRQ